MEKEEYIRKGRFYRKGRSRQKEQNKRKKLERTLREESEQYYFLCKLSLLEQACGKLYAHLFPTINLFLPCICPRAQPL